MSHSSFECSASRFHLRNFSASERQYVYESSFVIISMHASFVKFRLAKSQTTITCMSHAKLKWREAASSTTSAYKQSAFVILDYMYVIVGRYLRKVAKNPTQNTWLVSNTAVWLCWRHLSFLPAIHDYCMFSFCNCLHLLLSSRCHAWVRTVQRTSFCYIFV
jgi:hypothetical protein